MTVRTLSCRQLAELLTGRLLPAGASPTAGAAAVAGGMPDGEPVDPDTILTGISPLRDAVPGEATVLAHHRYLPLVATTRATLVIAGDDAGPLPRPSLRVRSIYPALATALGWFHPPRPLVAGIHPTAVVDPAAVVDATAQIGPLVVIGAGARIGPRARIDAQVFLGEFAVVGADAHLHPQVMIGDRCRVGARVVIHSGAVVGADGFGFVSGGKAGGATKIPQVGIVDIADDVEIGAGVTIDRATMGRTSIGRGTKIDNLVHVAHNVQIGEDCIIVAQVGISGSTTLEDRVTLAGQVGVVGHITIGRGATVAARGVPTHDVAPGETVSGFPARPHREERRIMAAIGRLPEMARTLTTIKNILKIGESAS